MAIFCDERINDTLLLSDQDHGFFVFIAKAGSVDHIWPV
jgi:hypothetical protein